MLLLLVVGYLALLGVVFWQGWVTGSGFRALSGAIQAIPEAMDRDGLDALHARVTELEVQVDVLPRTYEDFWKKARASEERSRTLVRRALAELDDGEEYAGELRAQAEQLGILDGGGGDGRRVPAVRNGMESRPEDQSGAGDPEAMSYATAMARKWGRG